MLLSLTSARRLMKFNRVRLTAASDAKGLVERAYSWPEEVAMHSETGTFMLLPVSRLVEGYLVDRHYHLRRLDDRG
jgi:hypothetical protein